MKILFVYPSSDHSYPLQLGALSAYIKLHHHTAKLLPLIITKSLNSAHYHQLFQTLRTYQPDYVGFSCYETAYTWIDRLSAQIKSRYPRIKIIWGGYYPTLNPQELIKNPHVDILCRGEGEQPLVDLFTHPNRTDIPNLWIKKSNRVYQNRVRPLTQNLDELPFPDRDMLDYQSQLNQEPLNDRTIKVMASRGCPFQCTYCSNTYLKAVYPNPEHYLRLRSPQNVIQEIIELKKHYLFDKVGFHDDNLTLDLDWLTQFSKLYAKHIKLPFYCATRVERCTPKILSLLKKAGCYLLLIGVESGNEKYRSQMMKRYMTNHQTIQAFLLAKKHHLLTWSFTMVGLPFETRQMLWETIWLNLRCRPDFVMASIYYPLTGTELGNLCHQHHWVNSRKKASITSYAWNSILDHPNLFPWEIRLAKYFNSATAITSRFFWHNLAIRLKSYLFHPS